MNQVSRQNAKNDIKKSSKNLVNDSNFGYNCRNNIDNYLLEPICDKIEELSYVQKYSNLFEPAVSQFINSHLFREKQEKDYEGILNKIDNNEIRFELLKQPILIKS